MDTTELFQVIFSVNAFVCGTISAYWWYKSGRVVIDVASVPDDIKKVVEAINESSGCNRVAANVTVLALWCSIWAGLMPLLARLFPN